MNDVLAQPQTVIIDNKTISYISSISCVHDFAVPTFPLNVPYPVMLLL